MALQMPVDQRAVVHSHGIKLRLLPSEEPVIRLKLEVCQVHESHPIDKRKSRVLEILLPQGCRRARVRGRALELRKGLLGRWRVEHVRGHAWGHATTCQGLSPRCSTHETARLHHRHMRVLKHMHELPQPWLLHIGREQRRGGLWSLPGKVHRDHGLCHFSVPVVQIDNCEAVVTVGSIWRVVAHKAAPDGLKFCRAEPLQIALAMHAHGRLCRIARGSITRQAGVQELRVVVCRWEYCDRGWAGGSVVRVQGLRSDPGGKHNALGTVGAEEEDASTHPQHQHHQEPHHFVLHHAVLGMDPGEVQPQRT
mmetsp:Transcript_76077/g.126855  ORF Transcript_76077/g.126855 Transcript_76077/m.126855 type:complete len:309 (+) Transcript_76077:1807-2733(+)